MRPRLATHPKPATKNCRARCAEPSPTAIQDRTYAVVAKALWNIPTTKARIGQLKHNSTFSTASMHDRQAAILLEQGLTGRKA